MQKNISLEALLFKILVVNSRQDEHAFFTSLRCPLACKVIVATDAQEGLETILDNDIDFMIISAELDGMPGYEMVKIMAEDDEFRHIPFMFLLDENPPLPATELYRLGAVACIPFAHLPHQLPNLMHLMQSAQSEMHRLHAEINATNAFSITDQLTGAFNRYKFDDDVKNQIARYARYSQPFSLIVLDIDHFKSINDTYGHAAGDQVLIELSKLIRESTRKLDTLYRMGGEEFIILLENTQTEGAAFLAEQLRRRVEAFMFNHGRLQVTSSFGVAEYRRLEEIEALVERADAALYTAKESGRNRVVSS